MIEENNAIKNQIDDTDFHLSQLSKIQTYSEETKSTINKLTEFKEVAQKEVLKGINRRWFQIEKFTLIIWYNLGNQIIGFQLCYGKNGSDKAISWYNEKEFSHRNIDYGKSINLTPIMSEDSGQIDRKIFEDFYNYTENLENEIVEFIKDKEEKMISKLKTKS